MAAMMMGAMMNAMGGGGMTGPPCELYDGTSLTKGSCGACVARLALQAAAAGSRAVPLVLRQGTARPLSSGARHSTRSGGTLAVALTFAAIGARAAHPSTLRPATPRVLAQARRGARGDSR